MQKSPHYLLTPPMITASSLDLMEQLIQMAKQEDLDSTLLADLQALQPRFTVDYRAAIQRNRKEVEKLLGGEIVKRYYYHRGYYAYMLRYDEQIRRAIQEITRH